MAVSVVGGAWKLTVIEHLLEGPQRFGELRRDIGTVGDRALTRKLRELEEDGLIHREVFAEVPPRVEYSLTDLGETLRPIVDDLRAWGRRWAAAQGEELPG